MTGGALAGETGAIARVTIVTVSYDSAHVLATMLASLPAGTPVVVVDNGSRDDTAAVAGRHGARLVGLPANMGFGRGCNAGAAMAATEFLFFVNPDATLEPGCIEALVAAADALPAASAFNPQILSSSGRVQYRHRSILLPRAEWMAPDVPQVLSEAATLLGGAMMCRRAAFEAVGGFDPAIFLYHEDDDLAIRLRRRCGPLFAVPAAVVRHDAGHSSGRGPEIGRLKGFHMARSRVYALAKHGRPLPWLRTFGSALAGLAMPHNLLSARRRAKHLGQLAGAWSALADGGRFDAP